MFEQIIDYILECALKHKAVKYGKYQSRILINQQNNNAYMQVNIEDDPFFQLLTTQNNIFTLTINLDILGFTSDKYSILQAQSDALQIGVELISFIDQDRKFMGQMSIHDYSFLGLSHFTDDNAAGQRLTLELQIPNPINLCEYLDNFEDEPTIEPVDKDIDLTDINPPTSKNDLILRPIRLKTKP